MRSVLFAYAAYKKLDPAKAGAHFSGVCTEAEWVPAFAGNPSKRTKPTHPVLARLAVKLTREESGWEAGGDQRVDDRLYVATVLRLDNDIELGTLD
jgi:hypothetical protein